MAKSHLGIFLFPIKFSVCVIAYYTLNCHSNLIPGFSFVIGHLQANQLETRLKSVNLVGDMIALPGSSIAETFQPTFSEFLNRLTDGDFGVRTSVLKHVKSCLLSNPSRAEAPQIICESIGCMYNIQS